MENNLTELNKHLYAQLGRLSEENLSGEKLTVEVNRASAITAVSDQILKSNEVVLKAMSLVQKAGIDIVPMVQGGVAGLPEMNVSYKKVNVTPKPYPCKKDDPIGDCVDPKNRNCTDCLFNSK